MQTSQILNAPLIDIIFDGRNKDYGAYELRKNYSGRIGRAMLIMFLIVSLVFGGMLMGNNKNGKPRYIIQEGPTLSIVKEDKPKIPEPEIPKKQEVPVKTEKYLDIKIVDKPFVDPPPTIEEVSKAMPGTEKRPGIDYDSVQGPPLNVPGDPKGIIEPPKKVDDGPVADVDVDAKFNGNWKGFLEKYLNPEVPVQHGAPAGTYSVVIQFVVDLDGSMSEIKALTDQGYGMEQEAIRVIKKAGNWQPGIYHGFPVRSYRKQVITFQVVEE